MATDCNGFLNEASKVTHFLRLFFLLLSPLADTAAPNSSQESIRINLIKITQIIGVDSYVPSNNYSISLHGFQRVRSVTGQS